MTSNLKIKMLFIMSILWVFTISQGPNEIVKSSDEIFGTKEDLEIKRYICKSKVYYNI